jgi:salicylate hydroxylase
MLGAARVNFNMFIEADPLQAAGRDGRLRGMARMDPLGETMFGFLFDHDAVAAAEAPPHVPPPAPKLMARPESQRAFELWRGALTLEDRARLWVGEREGYERFLAGLCPLPDAVVTEALVCDAVPALAVRPRGAHAQNGPVVLYLHGGCYTMGSARTAVAPAARLAAAIGGWALIPDYRLAPEHAFPAALDDCLAAYRWLAREHPHTGIVASGEGAGGGLAVAMAVALRDAGASLPAALHVVSPFCDLTVSSPAANAPAERDPWLNRDRLRVSAASYIHGADPATPLISPAYADLSGLPALLIQGAQDEVLRDDARALADAAESAGVSVTLVTVPDSVHAFTVFDFLPESGEAVHQFAAHVAGALGA